MILPEVVSAVPLVISVSWCGETAAKLGVLPTESVHGQHTSANMQQQVSIWSSGVVLCFIFARADCARHALYMFDANDLSAL